MPNDSYFKTLIGTFHFFTTEDLSSVRRAFDAAKAICGVVSVFRVPAMSGPWDKLGVIGHRTRQQILGDMSSTKDRDELARLKRELDGVSQQYLKVGRCLPPQSVTVAA